ncbi:hypothetical protein JL721_10740 [Aureococcus anophagefferens]|nr:hypothetical protein JL721_10740 [Aureococcus anophagefferens]
MDATLSALLQKMLCADNALRVAAEAEYASLLQADPTAVAAALVGVCCGGGVATAWASTQTTRAAAASSPGRSAARRTRGRAALVARRRGGVAAGARGGGARRRGAGRRPRRAVRAEAVAACGRPAFVAECEYPEHFAAAADAVASAVATLANAARGGHAAACRDILAALATLLDEPLVSWTTYLPSKARSLEAHVESVGDACAGILGAGDATADLARVALEVLGALLEAAMYWRRAAPGLGVASARASGRVRRSSAARGGVFDCEPSRRFGDLRRLVALATREAGEASSALTRRVLGGAARWCDALLGARRGDALRLGVARVVALLACAAADRDVAYDTFGSVRDARAFAAEHCGCDVVTCFSASDEATYYALDGSTLATNEVALRSLYEWLRFAPTAVTVGRGRARARGAGGGGRPAFFAAVAPTLLRHAAALRTGAAARRSCPSTARGSGGSDGDFSGRAPVAQALTMVLEALAELLEMPGACGD